MEELFNEFVNEHLLRTFLPAFHPEEDCREPADVPLQATAQSH